MGINDYKFKIDMENEQIYLTTVDFKKSLEQET